MQTVGDAGHRVVSLVDCFSNFALHVVSGRDFSRWKIGLITAGGTLGTMPGEVVGHWAGNSHTNMHGLLFRGLDGFSGDVVLQAQAGLFTAPGGSSTTLKSAFAIPSEGAIVLKSKRYVHRVHVTVVLDPLQANLG